MEAMGVERGRRAGLDRFTIRALSSVRDRKRRREARQPMSRFGPNGRIFNCSCRQRASTIPPHFGLGVVMARGINKVILVGNLGKDPETRYMPNGKPVTNFSIATSESWTDKQSGDKQERTEWHNIVMFEKLAEIAAEYLRKGSQVYVEGSLRTRKWQDKEGKDRYTTEIVARDIQMLG